MPVSEKSIWVAIDGGLSGLGKSISCLLGEEHLDYDRRRFYSSLKILDMSITKFIEHTLLQTNPLQPLRLGMV